MSQVRMASSMRKDWQEFKDAPAIMHYAYALGKVCILQQLAEAERISLPNDVRDSLAQFELDWEETGLTSVLHK
jgi:hypothetical protein